MGLDSGGLCLGAPCATSGQGQQRDLGSSSGCTRESLPRLLACPGSHTSRTGAGVLVRNESAKVQPAGNLLPFPCLHERGEGLTHARSASRRLMGPFPVACWKEEPARRAPALGACRRWTEALSILKALDLLGSRTSPPASRGCGHSWGHGWEITGLRPQMNCWNQGGSEGPAHVFSREPPTERGHPH